MRLILVDHARKGRAHKRGGGANKVELKEAMAALPQRPADVVALDDALTALAAINPRKANRGDIARAGYFHRDRGQGHANGATLAMPGNDGRRRK